jgi:hypothetical protein
VEELAGLQVLHKLHRRCATYEALIYDAAAMGIEVAE